MGEPNKSKSKKRGKENSEIYTEPGMGLASKNYRRETDSDHEQDDYSVSHSPDGDASPMDEETPSRDSQSYPAEVNIQRLTLGTTTLQGTAETDFAVHPEYFVQSNISVEINSMELQLRTILVPRKGQSVVVQRVVLAPPQHQQKNYCYDMEIGMLVMCDRLKLRDSSLFCCSANPQQQQAMLLLRKGYFMRKIPTRSGLIESYPDTILVSGVRYRLHHAAQQKHFCFAFPSDERFTLSYGECKVVGVTADGQPDPSQVVQSAVLLKQGHNPACGWDAVRLPPGFDFYRAGGQLWQPPYGEVYKAHRLPAISSVESAGAEFTFRGAEEVAIKVVRHPNTYLPGAEQMWHTVDGKEFPPQELISVQVPAPDVQLTSKHLAGHFELQRDKGRNENLMTEIETMHFIATAVERIVSEHTARSSSSGSSGGSSSRSGADPSHLLGRFIGHREVCISSDNLFIVSKYAAYGSLAGYVKRSRQPTEALGEQAVKHILRHLLQALVFMHERGMAHQDISMENAVLQALVDAVLQARHGEFLPEAEFLRLDTVLIDMGHVGVHERNPEHSNLLHAALNSSSMTINTATTCESCSTDGYVAGLATATPLGHPRTFSMEVPPTESCSRAPSPPTRRYKLRPMPQYPLGKALYRAPEMSPVLHASLGKRDSTATSSSGSSSSPREYCGMSFDMFQLGVLAIFLLTGCAPYQPVPNGEVAMKNERDWMASIENDKLGDHCVSPLPGAAGAETAEPTALRRLVSKEALSFLRQLLQFKAENRPSAEAALRDPWLQRS